MTTDDIKTVQIMLETNQEYIAKTALMYADALIAESEKGGHND